MTKVEKALQWMLDTAADQRHGYSQQSRWGPDYDCSSAVITSYENAGVPVKTNGATYTGNMRKPFLKCGFEIVPVDFSTGAGLQPGDVLLNEYGRGTRGNGHAAMYAGNGNIVHARGQSYGSSATGDQGSEFAVTPYHDNPWDICLRYTAEKKEPEPLNEKVKWTGTLTHRAAVRTWAGKKYPKIKTYPLLKKGDKVGVCDTVQSDIGTDWYYIQIDGPKGTVYGFTAARWIEK